MMQWPMMTWAQLAGAVATVPLSGWLLLRFYLCAPPAVYRPQGRPCWPLAAGAATAESLRCVHINVWSGSTYELLPPGAAWPVHLLCGRFGSYETAGQSEERFSQLVAGLKELRPSVISVNEADSAGWVRFSSGQRFGCVPGFHPNYV